MTPKQLRNNLLIIRDRLASLQQSAQRESLKSESQRLTARAPINMAENASEEQELDMIVSRLNSSTETLSQIDDALGWLDAGKFNVCAECGKEIGERRLRIQPWAMLCVDCQRKCEEGKL